MDQSLESVGGTKYPSQAQPMSQPRPHTKLVPGRMSQNSGHQQRQPKSPGPQQRHQPPPSRPERDTKLSLNMLESTAYKYNEDNK